MVAGSQSCNGVKHDLIPGFAGVGVDGFLKYTIDIHIGDARPGVAEADPARARSRKTERNGARQGQLRAAAAVVRVSVIVPVTGVLRRSVILLDTCRRAAGGIYSQCRRR